jgi:hypothetical protein
MRTVRNPKPGFRTVSVPNLAHFLAQPGASSPHSDYARRRVRLCESRPPPLSGWPGWWSKVLVLRSRTAAWKKKYRNRWDSFRKNSNPTQELRR